MEYSIDSKIIRGKNRNMGKWSLKDFINNLAFTFTFKAHFRKQKYDTIIMMIVDELNLNENIN
jgi:hypothetical protein